MTVVERIIKELGGPTAIHRETGFPVQTIHDWKRNGNIPHWRRNAIIAAAQRLGKVLDSEAAQYLASREKAAA